MLETPTVTAYVFRGWHSYIEMHTRYYKDIDFIMKSVIDAKDVSEHSTLSKSL